MKKRKDQRNTGHILRTHNRWHKMETIISVIPVLNIVISTSLRICLKTILFYLGNIKEKQDEDNDPQQSLTKHPTWYSCKNINDLNSMLCYTKPGDNAANWKIVLPKGLIVPTIRWYHQVTGHPGSKKLYQHIRQQYYNCDLRRLVDNFKCHYFQRNELDVKSNTDLIGPWIA
jgi:hypothetical protein